MQILNIAGYKFTPLDDLSALREHLMSACLSLSLKGTLLLSHEGINISLAGEKENVLVFIQRLKSDSRFSDISFHQTYSTHQPFKHLKIKLRKEIITLKQPDANPLTQTAPNLSPLEFKLWLDEKRDITILDTRNDYEVRFGTFEGAVNLQIDDFGEFPTAMTKVDNNKPIVMFCTGGIRCEKAALYMQHHGYKEVYQLKGGILGYFAAVGAAHYQGECFVFDERIAVDANLNHTHTVQCATCQGPVTKEQQACPACT